jgi:hypothetical protein
MSRVTRIALAFAGMGTLFTGWNVSLPVKADTSRVVVVSEAAKNAAPKEIPLLKTQQQPFAFTRREGFQDTKIYSAYSPVYDYYRIKKAKRHNFRNRKR